MFFNKQIQKAMDKVYELDNHKWIQIIIEQMNRWF